jgi:hypothetical protein
VKAQDLPSEYRKWDIQLRVRCCKLKAIEPRLVTCTEVSHHHAQVSAPPSTLISSWAHSRVFRSKMSNLDVTAMVKELRGQIVGMRCASMYVALCSRCDASTSC